MNRDELVNGMSDFSGIKFRENVPLSLEKVKFFSNDLGREIEAELLEKRKHTSKLKVDDKEIIKKNKQLIQENK